MCAVSVLSERFHALQLAVLPLILRENVETNMYKSNILRSSGFPKDSDAFFECSNVQFFSYSFYILGFK